VRWLLHYGFDDLRTCVCFCQGGCPATAEVHATGTCDDASPVVFPADGETCQPVGANKYVQLSEASDPCSAVAEEDGEIEGNSPITVCCGEQFED
jgi:hypothetical protein